tara:strand:- start:368 stop:1351 length:984 start_codon:yes stop_codon:yes gene_type:complete
MKFLVTGGAGYIGSHMVKYLQDRSFKVDVIDNFSSGNRWALENCNIFENDLLDKTALYNILSQNNYDAVFHFAAKSIANDSFIFEQEYIENNVIASKNLLDGIIKYNIKNIIFSSSASIFGLANSSKVDENHSKNPINPYGKTKLIFEEMLREYSNNYNLNAAILRYFNAAGADETTRIGEFHSPETHLIPSIFNNLINKGDVFKIYGNDHKTKDGTCVRDYIHVSDLVSAHYLAFKKLINSKGCFDYNLGNGNGFSVLEIIRACESVTNRVLRYEFVSKREGEPHYLVANSTKAISELKWEIIHHDINEIIKSAWRWHLRLYNEII